jgi:phosphoglycolate phosphatase-like HAD superfamily hydrolase
MQGQADRGETMTAVVLFDIDLTMIRTNGAGSGAMTETLKAMLGVEDGFANMSFAGRTDRALLREALTNCGRQDHDLESFVPAFEVEYLPRLTRHLGERGGVVLPGVRETLAAVRALPHTRIGLATGNFRRAAEIKLRHFDLWGHFLDGGYADDGEERHQLVAAAVRRMEVHCPGSPSCVIVIGDSVHDITAAMANGAVAVGVATGSATVDELHAAGASVVFDDLSDPQRLVQLIAARVG